MKRTIALILVLILALIPVVACSDANEATDKNDSNTSAESNDTPAENDDSETLQAAPNELDDNDQNDDDNHEEDLSLSGVLYDFTFKLDDDTITLPLTIGEFRALGWDHSDLYILPDTVEGHTRLLMPYFIKNGSEANIQVLNASEDELPINECIIYNIKVSLDQEKSPVIELPKGIKLGVSTKDDLINAFGWPTKLGILAGDNGGEVFEYLAEHFGLSTGIWGPSANGVTIYTSGDPHHIITYIEISNIS